MMLLNDVALTGNEFECVDLEFKSTFLECE